MTIREFGAENGKVVVLIHPSLVTWDYFQDVIPLLEKEYHLFVPVLPGYDLSDDSEFISVEACAAEIEEQLIGAGIEEVEAVYGCSMGGSIALRMAADRRLAVGHFILDGGITPYQLPYILTRFIALRDFCMMVIGKLGGEKLLVRAFSSSEYSEEDMKYVANILKHCTYKTLWNTFDSCNNYGMPKEPMHFDGTTHYWYAEKERKARDWDVKYMKKYVPDTIFREFRGMDHGDMALFHPAMLAEEIRTLEKSAQ